MTRQNPTPKSPEEPMSYQQYMIDEGWKSLAVGNSAPAVLEIPEPILIISVSIRQWNSNLDWRERMHFGHAVQGHIRGILLEDDRWGGCITLDDCHFLAFRSGWNTNSGGILDHCRELVDEARTHLLCDVSCCVGTPTTKANIPAMIDELLHLAEGNVTDAPIIVHGQVLHRDNTVEIQMERWRLWLQDEKFDQLLTSVEEYFCNGVQYFTAESLHQLNQDFIQMLYGVMYSKQIPAHIIFERSENAETFKNAPSSIANTVTWIFYAVTAFSKHLSNRRTNEDYTQKARDYILSHLCEDFTRQDIAEYVHLSQNHLARLFRQALGMSISDFILQERMKLAFSYLTGTSMPVYEVALRVGYENYSYFLTLFRRVSGMTPSQYRREYTKNTLKEGEL